MDIKKIIIKRGIIKRENGGWGKDCPYTEGKSVLGSDGFSRIDTFSLAGKLLSPLVTLKGFAATGCWVLFHSRFSLTAWGVYWSLPENAIRVPISTHRSSGHNKPSPFSLCLFSSYAPSPGKTRAPPPRVTRLRHACILVNLKTLNFEQQP